MSLKVNILNGLFLILKFCISSQAQQKLNCDSIFHEKENIFIFYEEIVTPEGGFYQFYDHLGKKFSSFRDQGKIYVEFIVDTLGSVHCSRVVKSDNEGLNTEALEIIEQTKFSPAKQRGKKIIVPMVLPIYFGEPPKQKKKTLPKQKELP